MVWQDRLPRVDADLTDPKIHKRQYEHLRLGYELRCAKGMDACNCLQGSGYLDGARYYACKNAVTVPGWWRNPWLARGLVAVPSLYVAYRAFKWATYVPPKKSQYSYAVEDGSR